MSYDIAEMASALFFLDLKGKVSGNVENHVEGCANADRDQTLLARNYRGDIPMSAVEKFPILLSEAEEESSAVPPCFSDEGINVRPPSLSTFQFIHYYGDCRYILCQINQMLYRSLTPDSATVPLYSTQQPLPAGSHEAQHQCHRNPPLPSQNS